MKKYGFIKVGALCPKLKIANPIFNSKELIREINSKTDLDIILTPELSITSYTAGDLFLQKKLIDGSINALSEILKQTKNNKAYIIVGMPLIHESRLYNVAVVINKGNILGIIPKTYIPNYQEFYEKRWFTSGDEIKKHQVNLLGQDVKFSKNILFQDKENKSICFAVEICEDLWTVNPPSNDHALNGATIILNPSASNEIIGKREYRKNLIENTSARLICSYIYVSSGMYESTTDLVFSGDAIITENGSTLSQGKRFSLDSIWTESEIDVQKLENDRLKNKSFADSKSKTDYDVVEINIQNKDVAVTRKYSITPFVPTKLTDKYSRCEEILEIQSSSLVKRMLHINSKKTVIGISGGMDSTLAFLVIIKAYQKMNLDFKNIICVTMPGFGTTGRTYKNAYNLIKEYGATFCEVDIKKSVVQHFKDINLREDDRSITYENSQARERTQILMDIANKENALVIGTVDLSELALGWCTYNGDHMSNYAVNVSIPKTLVRHLIEFIYEENKSLTLKDIINTPISPELLPPDEKGNILQVTEDFVGPYILHDYFLYHFLRYGCPKEKILMLAKISFKDLYQEEIIEKWLNIFFKRFFQNQFKRSCIPDGPKVGSISLSPRGDFRMPSDASNELWSDL